ncbi:MAG: S1C family serine protease [Candidatus Krumholzibacteriia bacterium]
MYETTFSERWPRWQPYLLGLFTGMVVGLVVLLVLLGTGRLEGPGAVRTDARGSALPAEPGADGPVDSASLLHASRRNAIVNAVEMTRRAVVTISAAGPRIVRSPVHDLFTWPFRRQRVVSMQWIGSGFLIDPAGYIITTEHVVRGATDLVVSLGDGSSAHAEIVGLAPRFDLALLRVDTDLDLSAATLGDSDDLMVGEWAIAIGSPFGNKLDDPQPSVSVGVISAVNRDIRPPPQTEVGWPYFNLLQTDAAINIGNSGGPLVNTTGEVIGANMALINPTAGQSNVGVNFSIPINTVKWVAEELRDFGQVRTPWVGWRLDEVVPPDVRAAINMAEEDGVLIVGSVEPDSPADVAGIEVGDVIHTINGQDPYSRARAERILFDTRVGGEPIEVQFFRKRDGQLVSAMLDVLENPSTRAERLRRRPRRLG